MTTVIQQSKKAAISARLNVQSNKFTFMATRINDDTVNVHSVLNHHLIFSTIKEAQSKFKEYNG